VLFGDTCRNPNAIESFTDREVRMSEHAVQSDATVDDTTVAIATDSDIVAARERGRSLVGGLGFSTTETTLVTTAISELARNIVRHAKRGEIVLRPLNERGARGILVIARDQGPGIVDVQQALSGQGARRAMGLCGVRRLVDEFDIASVAGSGTTVAVRMWSRPTRTL
jgi:serine/threonine-protein kinase RsbT